MPPNTIGNTIFKIVLLGLWIVLLGIVDFFFFFDSITICTGNTIGNTIQYYYQYKINSINSF